MRESTGTGENVNNAGRDEFELERLKWGWEDGGKKDEVILIRE